MFERLVMKLLSSIFLLTLFLCQSSLAKDVTIGTVPNSAEEFVTLRNELAQTPEGGAACLVAALLSFSKSQDLGMQCLTIAIDQRNVINGGVYKGYAPNGSVMYHVNRITGYKMWPYLGYAYIKGAKAASNYQVSPPLVIETYRQKNSGTDESGEVKVFVNTDGFRARPVTLKRNDKGIWKAYEFSSLMLNVNPPASLTPTDDL
jgi:Domain of unknown function (DUF6935)